MHMSARLAAALSRLQQRVAGPDAERGDVPGWVMITIMTAAIVLVLWGFADDALVNAFEDALNSVTGGP